MWLYAFDQASKGHRLSADMPPATLPAEPAAGGCVQRAPHRRGSREPSSRGYRQRRTESTLERSSYNPLSKLFHGAQSTITHGKLRTTHTVDYSFFPEVPFSHNVFAPKRVERVQQEEDGGSPHTVQVRRRNGHEPAWWRVVLKQGGPVGRRHHGAGGLNAAR